MVAESLAVSQRIGIFMIPTIGRSSHGLQCCARNMVMLAACLTLQRWEASEFSAQTQTTEEHLMISFQVNDMTCGHCVSTITKAVKAEDATATLRFDLAAHRVDIEAGEADAAELSEAIKQAGYAPVQIDGANASNGPSTASARKRCCCG
jgi:copper chaperone